MPRKYNLTKFPPIKPVIRVIGPSIAYITLREDTYSLISSEDIEKVDKFNWSFSTIKGKTYVKRNLPRGGNNNKRSEYLHSLLVRRGEGRYVDHIDGNAFNNGYWNLRRGSNAQNMHNTHKHVDNTTGYKGVYIASGKRNKSYCARIGGKSLGYFYDPISAAQAYDSKAKELFGEFAKVNNV